ncbi:MAG: U32 family peptidase C-terminal domain-containing protein [Candidatus Micrarchaeia archaeon]
MEEEEKEVGEITHYFDKIGVAIVKVTNSIKVGDRISIKGKTTNFEQKVQSMQIEHVNVDEAGSGDEIGLKVDQQVREGDKVYKLL